MGNKTQTQNEAIRQHLESGKAITSAEAYEHFGCLRLGARIYDLIHAYGMDIKSVIISQNGKHFSEYSLR